MVPSEYPCHPAQHTDPPLQPPHHPVYLVQGNIGRRDVSQLKHVLENLGHLDFTVKVRAQFRHMNVRAVVLVATSVSYVSLYVPANRKFPEISFE